ncbi:trehalose-phosphatase [Hydrogenophaga sp. 5NK40-0174]
MDPVLDRSSALFLDFDGTLADIAPRPDAVQVDPDLLPVLERLHHALSGAVAIITGRVHTEIEQFLHPLSLPGAYEHGAAQRHAGGELTRRPEPRLDAVRAAAQTMADRHPGLVVEQKASGVSLHYRQAPELQQACTQIMTEAVRQDSQLQLLHGKAVLEVKSAHIGKGKAIEAFMAAPPFSGRRPVFAGDDVTDEAGFEVVQLEGGVAIKVGDGPTAAQHRLTSPEALRQWLRRQADRLEQEEDEEQR